LTTSKNPVIRRRLTGDSAYAGFGQALKDWLRRADRSQKELAYALHVDPSTVTNWAKGQKRPDERSLIRMLAVFKAWFGGTWNPLEALDAFECLGYHWSVIRGVSERHFEKGGLRKPSRSGGSRLALLNAASSCPRARSCILSE
jgi:transcriptional regulator with XRE-family HTH domain